MAGHAGLMGFFRGTGSGSTGRLSQMSRYPFLYPFQSDEEPPASTVGWALAALLFLLIAVVILITPINLPAPTGNLVPAGEMSYAANPELSSLRRFQLANEAVVVFVAENPLIRFLYTVDPGYGRLDSVFLAHNPQPALYRCYLIRNRR